ncbi:MAG TPA: inorganic phosphate transporter [Minicystis sp.]|nr:inorganic phosphate transporter [Minicystis sp.]
MLGLAVIVVLAVGFDFINGFHDAANSIATVVSTRVLSPRAAVVWAAFFNFVAFLVFGVAVAQSISKGVAPDIVTLPLVGAGLAGAIVWNLLTWWLGLPTSSSHALLGGLAGAAVAKAGFGSLDAPVFIKTGVFIVLAPLIGFGLGGLLMRLLVVTFGASSPRTVDRVFRRLQLVSAGFYSLGHGGNDAQKTMGIIAMALAASAATPGLGWIDATVGGYAFESTPALYAARATADAIVTTDRHVAAAVAQPAVTERVDAEVARVRRVRASVRGRPQLWIVLLCHLAIGLGTLSGGWRIVRTMGTRITKLAPPDGFAAETGGALSLFLATHWGIPVSTTHTITGAIIGAGSVHSVTAVRWGVAGRIVWAWILTWPMAGAVAAITYYVIHALGMS